MSARELQPLNRTGKGTARAVCLPVLRSGPMRSMGPALRHSRRRFPSDSIDSFGVAVEEVEC